jgi:two-component sensor histidine kinase
VQPPRYTFDKERLATLEAYNVLDTPAEPGFDDIVRLAALICATPVSLVSFVAENRQWFKAQVGFEPCETDLNSSVCAHALIESDLLIIEDLSIDPRTRDNPLVTGNPHIRFYAGAPLRAANGAVLGSLCVIDGKPRPGGLTAAQAEGLRNLARQVMSQLELRRALAQRDALLTENRSAELRRNGLLSVGDQLRAINSVPEATRAAAKIAGQTLGLVRAGFGRVDGAGEFIDIEEDWAADGYASLAGRQSLADHGDLGRRLASAEAIVVEDVATDPATASSREWLLRMGVRAMANLPTRDRGGVVALFFAHSDRPRVWVAEDLAFLQNVGDRVAVSVARTEAVALQRFLNLELSHRMKNTLAMVQAIARQTLGSIPDQAPVEAFDSRLQALSLAHDALFKQNWSTARLGDVVRSVIGNIQSIDRFTFSGPHVAIGPRATLSISLLLHELSTNALKYGALSYTDGHVYIDWKVTDENLTFTWREKGGPAAVEPTRRGFGSRLISLGLVGTGGVALRYLPTGFEGNFDASLSQLREA